MWRVRRCAASRARQPSSLAGGDLAPPTIRCKEVVKTCRRTPAADGIADTSLSFTSACETNSFCSDRLVNSQCAHTATHNAHGQYYAPSFTDKRCAPSSHALQPTNSAHIRLRHRLTITSTSIFALLGRQAVQQRCLARCIVAFTVSSILLPSRSRRLSCRLDNVGPFTQQAQRRWDHADTESCINSLGAALSSSVPDHL